MMGWRYWIKCPVGSKPSRRVCFWLPLGFGEEPEARTFYGQAALPPEGLTEIRGFL